jgi:hypothetical protein
VVRTAAVMNVAIFWDIAPCSPYVNDVSEQCIISICTECLATFLALISCSTDFYIEDGGDDSSETSVDIWNIQ